MLSGRVIKPEMLIITFIEEDMMKMNRIVFAAVVVMVVALVSCGGGGGGGAPGFPGGDIDDLENFPGRAVATENEVYELLSYLNSTTSFWSCLSNIDSQADAKASERYDTLWYLASTAKTSESASVDFDGSSLSKAFGTGASAHTVVAEVRGSAQASFSASKSLSSYWLSPAEGDWYETSGSYDKTYKITHGSFPGIGAAPGFAQGVIEKTGSFSIKNTMLRKEAPGNEGWQEENSNSGEATVSVALSVSDGIKGAKVLISYGYESEMTIYRAGDMTMGSSMSSLEVYNNAGDLLFTLMNGAGGDLLDNADTYLTAGESSPW
jgi:hypothetical protein